MKLESLQFPWNLVPRNLVLGVVFLGSLTTHLAATKIGEALTPICRPQLEKVSLMTCQLRDLFKDGVQNHLTEPTENSQDSNQLMEYLDSGANESQLGGYSVCGFTLAIPWSGRDICPPNPEGQGNRSRNPHADEGIH